MSNRDLARPHVYVAGTSDRTLLLLHGTGADEHDLLNLGKQLDPAANLLSPRGMHLEAGMNRFFERYADGSFNEASIQQATSELADFVLAAANEYGFDLTNITAVGFSNGANTAAALMITNPELLSSAVLFGTTRPFKVLPSQPDLANKRIWIANGELDPYAPEAVTQTWVRELEGLGAQVHWLRHPGGHQISPAHLKEISSQLA